MASNCPHTCCGDLENVYYGASKYQTDQPTMKEELQDTLEDWTREENTNTSSNKEQNKSVVENLLLRTLGPGNDNGDGDGDGAGAGTDRAAKEQDETATEEATSDVAADNKIEAMVFMISGCEDSQTSADVYNVSNFSLPNANGKAGGACTSALLKVLYTNHRAVSDLTFVQVLNKMRSILRSQRYTQTPQLTSSQPLDVSHTFYIVPPDCQGTRRAVLIGINYVGHNDGELSGCHNDCLNMKDYIMNVWGFKEENITILMDDNYHTTPTRSNILSAYKKVAAASSSGDAVFCHYSGHGARLRDDDWDEEKDGYDETLVPVDYTSAGQIRDDDLYQSLVCAMPAGVHLVSLMDCCHSGTVLDLPYKYRADGSSSFYDSGKLDQLYSAGMCEGGSCSAALCISCICISIIVLVVVLPVMLT